MIELTRVDENGEKTVPVDIAEIASIGIDYKGCRLYFTNGNSFRIKEKQSVLEQMIREEIGRK